MNTIKHRAKCEDTGRWLYGYYAKVHTQAYGIEEVIIESTTGKPMGIKPNTVCVFTSLINKSGEVYFGDIVKTKKGIGEVKWDSENFEAYIDYHNGEEEKLTHIDTSTTTIGNIFDNPELLSKKEKDEA